ncbi:MAG TPA: hypothetical protein PKY82_11215 [Pyrinomonadaceae bacterium]|nr:hypothetical protein [Pyrinomonadaceae bacterium]
MLHKTLSANKYFLIGAILSGLIISVFALAPQIDLWMNCENQCHGIYAITDIDEPFYAAYLQSLMDGKPRRNSPYSGAVDSETTPQKESGLSIQFLATYPPVFFAKIFNLSISNLMILTSLLVGFFAAIAVYWLVFHFTEDSICAFAGALVVILLGATVGGQGATLSLIPSYDPHLLHNLIFLRRIVPAIGFPAQFLFIVFVWKFFNADSQSAKLKSAFLALCSFIFCVYSYYYFWTTVFAWFFSLIGLMMIFRFEKLKENLFYLLGFGFSLVLVLIPYFILVSNRENDVDSVIVMNLTHESDLLRIPEIFSYLTTIIILIFAILRRIDLSDIKIIFLLSLNLVTIIVFNQQIITGRSIQPFHYEFYCVNYLATLSSFLLLFILLKRIVDFDRLKLLMLLLVSIPFCVGSFDTIYSVAINRDVNLWRDKLIPVSERIKEISQTQEFRGTKQKPVILTFDFIDTPFFTGIEIPTLTSQPMLWAPHLWFHPDINQKENISRLNTFLYYQSISKDNLNSNLFRGKVSWEALAYFGADKLSPIQTGKSTIITKDEIAKVIDDYDKFTQNFTYQEAQKLPISLVVVNKNFENNFTNLDRWYQRDAGEVVGDYILYQVKLRQP